MISTTWYLVCWYIKNWLESGPVTADLTTVVVHRYKSLKNDIKPVHSLVSYKVCSKSVPRRKFCIAGLFFIWCRV